MQIVAVSDIYGDLDSVQTLIKKLDDSHARDRIIIVAGDIGFALNDENYDDHVAQILKYLTSVAKLVVFVPGDSDKKHILSTVENVTNLDGQNLVITIEGVKVGLFGLGGGNTHSLRKPEFSTYLWDDDIAKEIFSQTLKTNFEKMTLEKPDYSIFVTHVPPFGVVDYSTPISLKEKFLPEEIVNDTVNDVLLPKTKDAKKPKFGERRIGSKLIKEFVDLYIPDIHIFGHVHKEGGKFHYSETTKFFNVSHLSSQPYKLTGRKFMIMDISKNDMHVSFSSAVEENMPFEDFVETYL